MRGLGLGLSTVRLFLLGMPEALGEEKQRSERKLGKPLGSRSVGECSTRMCEALVLIITHKPCVPVPVYNPSVWEMGAGRPEIQGHPWLPSEFEMSLKYIRPCCKKVEINGNLKVNIEKLKYKGVFSEMC